MKLMPIGGLRTCPKCRFTWTTAFIHRTDCPSCAADIPSVESAWPHTCSRGHGAAGGGECTTCAQEGR